MFLDTSGMAFCRTAFFAPLLINTQKMARFEIKVEGIQKLQERLLQMKEGVEARLDMELSQLGEDAVTHAKLNKGYHDQTANLKNSISYALYKDGELVRQEIGNIPKPEASAAGQGQVSESLAVYASKAGVVAAKGYTLIVVAGMNYGEIGRAHV